jgi:hypothetical protein
MLREAFARAAARPEGQSGIDFLEAILRERPELREKIESGELVADYPIYGVKGNVVIIGDEVFKGPKTERYAVDFDKEPETLKQLKGKGLPVPEVLWESKDSLIYSMQKMPGVELTTFLDPSCATGTLTVQEKTDLGEQIADFIIGMALALPMHKGKYAMHPDLNLQNILIDPKTKKLTAILDFESIEYGDSNDLFSLVPWDDNAVWRKGMRRWRKVAGIKAATHSKPFANK